MPIGELIDGLGPNTATVLGGFDPGRIVRGAEFHDALEALPGDPDLLLLAPSAGGATPVEVAGLADRASRARVAGIALKCRDEDAAELAAVAETSGVPLVRVGEQVSWRLFDALLAQSLGEQRHSEDAHRDSGAEPLFALANELAEVFGGSVAIEDLGRRIIAYSSVPGQLIDRLRTQGILTRRVPDSPFNDDQYRTVLRSERPLKYPRLDDEEPRMACAIRAGTLPLGTIWAIDASGEDESTPEQENAIQNAATVAAAHLLDNLRSGEATQAPRAARLRTLLDGSDVAGSELAELGLPEERGSAMLVFAPADERPTALAQLRSTVQRHLALHRPEAVTVARGGRIYSLVAHDQQGGSLALVEPLVPVIDRLIGPGTRIALPGVAHRSGEVAELRRLADRLLGTASRHEATSGDRILTVSCLRPFLVLDRVGEILGLEEELRSPALARLAEEDPAFAETLIAWCSNFGNVARTARELGVHENTVRYRVRQIEEQYGIALADPDELLTTWLQLRALPTHAPAQEGSHA
ncbi:helix-turn-helix domain-containing protein [Leucobacter sp. CSA2]|uniref:Helix-turn-helix domain-containing protein n=1 Tax=Leucobacter edaphi TaxID=2796472 RepID=A0A934UYA0_9MICO|nr:helix-turn-helix domain-containing protein [Leucobacter edaphi]